MTLHGRFPSPPVFLGLTGPDGAGKSSQVALMAEALRVRGIVVVVRYAYGCPACRRPSMTLRPPPVTASAAKPGAIRRLHAFVDAVDLARQLVVAAVAAVVGALRRGGLPVILTDRSPLDSLVRYRDARAGPTGLLLLALFRLYRLIAVLDAPAELLRARDTEHSEQELEAQRRLYAAWAGAPPVVMVDSAQERSAVTTELLHLAEKATAHRVSREPPFAEGGRT